MVQAKSQNHIIQEFAIDIYTCLLYDSPMYIGKYKCS
jgi:alpha-glucuronidase